jgi:hypothetical protein
LNIWHNFSRFLTFTQLKYVSTKTLCCAVIRHLV